MRAASAGVEPGSSDGAPSLATDLADPEADDRPETAVARWISIAAAVALAACLAAWTWSNAVLLPLGDGWSWIAQAKGWHDGGFAGWWSEHPLYHTQHFYFVPAVIAVVVGPLVDYSFRAFAFLGLVMILALGVCAARWARRNGASSVEALFVFSIAVSLRHFENLVLGFQIGLISCVLFGVLAVDVAGTRPGRRGAALATVLALLSGLSSSAGLTTCFVVAAMRLFDVRRWRTWASLALLGVLSLWAIDRILVAMFSMSFVSDAVHLIAWERAPLIAWATLQLLGGGLIGGDSSVWLGLLALAGTMHVVATSLRASGRIDTAAGLVLLGLGSCFTIALARAPLQAVDSRYAIFACPVIAALLTELLRWLRPRRTVFGHAAIGMALLCLQLEAAREAKAYVTTTLNYERSLRTYLATLGTHGRVTAPELTEVNPGANDVILGLMEFVRERRWLTFSPSYRGVSTFDDLPKSRWLTTDAREEDGMLHFRGPGYVFTSMSCPDPSGSFARLEVVAKVTGASTIGFIERDRNGAVVNNSARPFPDVGEFRRRTMSATAAPGNSLEPYVYAAGPDDSVCVKTFVVVVGKNSLTP